MNQLTTKREMMSLIDTRKLKQGEEESSMKDVLLNNGEVANVIFLDRDCFAYPQRFKARPNQACDNCDHKEYRRDYCNLFKNKLISGCLIDSTWHDWDMTFRSVRCIMRGKDHSTARR